MKVGFFDSGLGGLTVLKEAIKNEGLSEEIYYLGDTKNTPYGTKDEEFVKKIIRENIETLVKIGCNPIVIACNTATSLCINELREKYKDIILIGTEPAVKVAADSRLNKKILVLATSITVRQEKLHNLINKLEIEDNVELVPADKLVRFAEDANCLNMNKEINEYIKSLLLNYNLNEFSHIVLGCTHFPLFSDNFKEVIKDINSNLKIEIVDGARGISKNLIRYINKINNCESYVGCNKKINIITTSKNDNFVLRAKQILNDEKINFNYKLQ